MSVSPASGFYISNKPWQSADWLIMRIIVSCSRRFHIWKAEDVSRAKSAAAGEMRGADWFWHFRTRPRRLGSSSGALLSVPVRKYCLWLRFRAETSPRSACFLQVYSLYHADCSCSLRVSVCVCVWLHNRCRPLSETQPAYYGWSGCACMRVHMQECCMPLCVCVYSDCCC